MYIQEEAAEGGESHLASCAKIYNEIAATRPDVIHHLADPSWIFDKYVCNSNKSLMSNLRKRADIVRQRSGTLERFYLISGTKDLDSASLDVQLQALQPLLEVQAFHP
jgi:Taurine catabolism dioxygenase TauD, TfdA family